MHIRPFEIALIGVFAVAGLIGLFYLSNYKEDPSETEKLYGERVLIWGTLDSMTMNNFLYDLSQVDRALEVVTYTEFDERAFDSALVNAIAEGRSPDLIIMSHKDLVSYRSKLQPMLFDERTFRDTYIDGAEIFLRSDGTYGIPFAVDPLVMYWNRDIFSSSGLALPPKTWESLVSQTTKAIVRTDDELKITQSAVAFGEYTNVTHAKDVIAMLLMQAGSTIVDEEGDSYFVTLKQGPENALSPGDAVLSFYSQFGIPSNALYSWNRAKNSDRDEFLGGNLAMYFGKGSEKHSLDRDNANLNFDIAPVPQGSGVTTARNYGDFYAFAIPRSSQNQKGAQAVALLFASSEHAKKIADGYGFAPVNRALFEGSITDPFMKVIYQSALISRGWLDPSPKESGEIFRKMVEEATSGARLKNVIIDAVYELEALF